jgi:predicted HTH transcriptional regulator
LGDSVYHFLAAEAEEEERRATRLELAAKMKLEESRKKVREVRDQAAEATQSPSSSSRTSLREITGDISRDPAKSELNVLRARQAGSFPSDSSQESGSGSPDLT